MNFKDDYIEWLEANGFNGQSPSKYASALNTVIKKTPEIVGTRSFFEYPIDECLRMVPILEQSITNNPKNTVNDHGTSMAALRQFRLFADDYRK